MTGSLRSNVSRAFLLAGLLAAAAAAQAATGFTVTHGQEAQVSPGMDRSAVQQYLGHPAQSHRFGGESGVTWTYNVSGTDLAVYDVQFDANDKVVSVGEREVSVD